MWQLKSDGKLRSDASSSISSVLIDPTVAATYEEIDPLELATAETIRISFANHADGRGFSYAKKLFKQFGTSQKRPVLIATGKLIPDQARMAFQSGFDVIELEDAEVARHSEASWRAALSNAVPNLYFKTPEHSASIASIWDARQTS